MHIPAEQHPIVTVPLSALVTPATDMAAVLASGRVSDTPDEPILLRACADQPGRFEVADGHHRIAAALRAGRHEINAYIDPVPDGEPHQPPFYPFPNRHRAPHRS
ncbi:MAG: ParB N-terminal domain-containing protein [Rhodococcus sp. (in: high G+C Gram-positive bacteria)]|uniref:ParB N-terminal domain-containing protein n=1 Tax=Rhodococcus sp. TaxID=1831 RepID=UPI003BB7D451